jgi:preprotein translocase SecE subunit|tara:strand:+ start:1463 stop:1786 length:324 start_codon:yes stop_codon:yes gene_type:complete
LSRELRRAQERAEKKQKKSANKPQSTGASIPNNTGVLNKNSEKGKKGSILKPRWIIETWNELRKVTWPPKKEIGHLTYVVVLVSLLFGAILGLADLVFSWVVEKVIL